MTIDTQSSSSLNEVINLQTLQRIQKAMVNQPRHLNALKAQRLSGHYRQMHDAIIRTQSKHIANMAPVVSYLLDLSIVKKLARVVCNWGTFSFSLLIVTLNIYIFTFSKFFSFRGIYIYETQSSNLLNYSAMNNPSSIINQLLQNLNIFLLKYGIAGQSLYSLFYQIIFSVASLSLFLIFSSLFELNFTRISKQSNNIFYLVIGYIFNASLCLFYIFNSVSMNIFYSGNLDLLVGYLLAPCIIWSYFILIKNFQTSKTQASNLALPSKIQNSQMQLRKLFLNLFVGLLFLIYTKIATSLAPYLLAICAILTIIVIAYQNIFNRESAPSIYLQKHRINMVFPKQEFVKVLMIVSVIMPSFILFKLLSTKKLEIFNLNELNLPILTLITGFAVVLLFSSLVFISKLQNLKKIFGNAIIMIVSGLILANTIFSITSFSQIRQNINYIQKPEIIERFGTYCNVDKRVLILPESQQAKTFFSPTVPINTNYLAASCTTRLENNLQLNSKAKTYLQNIDTAIVEDRQDITNEFINKLRVADLGDYLIIEDFENPTLKTLNNILSKYYPPLLSQETLKIYKIKSN